MDIRDTFIYIYNYIYYPRSSASIEHGIMPDTQHSCARTRTGHYGAVSKVQ